MLVASLRLKAGEWNKQLETTLVHMCYIGLLVVSRDWEKRSEGSCCRDPCLHPD